MFPALNPFIAQADLTAGLLGGLLIFAARVCDVSMGTIRVIYMLRGRRLISAVIAAFESAIFIVAIGSVLKGGVAGEPFKLAGYVLGFAGGVFVGMTIEGWIASGWTLLRVIPRDDPHGLMRRLRRHGEAVTLVPGEGRDGPRPILFLVVRRKRAGRVLAVVRRHAPDAFLTVDSVGQAMNGTLGPPAGGAGTLNPRLARIASMRMLFRK